MPGPASACVLGINEMFLAFESVAVMSLAACRGSGFRISTRVYGLVEGFVLDLRASGFAVAFVVWGLGLEVTGLGFRV